MLHFFRALFLLALANLLLELKVQLNTVLRLTFICNYSRKHKYCVYMETLKQVVIIWSFTKQLIFDKLSNLIKMNNSMLLTKQLNNYNFNTCMYNITINLKIFERWVESGLQVGDPPAHLPAPAPAPASAPPVSPVTPHTLFIRLLNPPRGTPIKYFPKLIYMHTNNLSL